MNDYRYCVLICATMLAACVSHRPVQAPDSFTPAPTPLPVAVEDSDASRSPGLTDGSENNTFTDACAPDDPGIECSDTEESKPPLLDRTQMTVFNVVNSSSQWFDGLFGSSEIDQGENVSKGRVSVGSQWDQRDAFKQRLRLKARVPLPALKERARLIVGRGNTDDFVDGSASDDIDTLPTRFNDYDDEDWLLGLGYSRDGELAKGWDFDAGIKLSTPLEPYVRATWHSNKVVGDAFLWRLRPRVFWQSQRGPGMSVNNIFDNVLTPSWLLRFWTILVLEDEIEGLGWTNSMTAYQSLSRNAALSYSVFATGQTDNDVPLQDYGAEIRYRKSIAREWLFIQLSTRLTWPREFAIEKRERNFGVGIEFEMQFGDWPGRKQVGATQR